MQKKELIPRIARWWLRVQDYDIEIEHRPAKRMEHVDALSRVPYEEARTIEVVDLRIDKAVIDKDDWLFSMQLQDERICQIVNNIKTNNNVEDKEYVLQHGRLLRKVDDKLLWVVPRSLRHRVVQNCHMQAGHMGVEKTLERLKTYMWFPRMRNFVKQFILSCMDCAYNKRKGGKAEIQYHFSDIEPVPFRTIHMDHLGPFPKSSKGKEHLLVIVDSFTKFTMLYPVKNTSTRFVIEALNEASSYVGMPLRIVTDRGSAFTSREFEKYCFENDIKHILTPVRTPRANGHAERTNRTILSMLLPMNSVDKKWDEKIRCVQWCINTMKNSTTGCTPHELLYGYKPRDILRNRVILSLQANDEALNDEQLTDLREAAAKRINEKRAAAKSRFDAAHATPHTFQEGDLVLAENEPPSGISRKLEPRFKGPFIVTKVLDHDRYVVEDLPQTRRTRKHYSSVYSIDKLKRWCQLPEDDDNDKEITSNELSEVAQVYQERPTVNECQKHREEEEYE